MKIDAEFSRRITVLSVLAMLSVVFIHSTACLTMANPAKWNVFAEILVTRSFTRWAVPFFFAVSGFWLGRGEFVRKDGSYRALLVKKGRTLLIPYLCWCLIGLLVALPLVLGNNILTGRSLFERTIFAMPGLWSKIDAFVGLTSVGPSSNAPLWYVRSLMILFLFAPILRCFVRYPLGRSLFLAAPLIYLMFFPIDPPYLALPSFAVAWFAFGLAISQLNVEEWRVPTAIFYVAAPLFAIAGLFIALLRADLLSIAPFSKSAILFRLEHLLVPAFGMVFFWGLYDRVAFLSATAIPWGLRQTFFIYCIHETICGYFLASAKYVLGKTDAVTFVCVLVVPWLVYAFCAILAVSVQKKLPRVYGLICGGRV